MADNAYGFAATLANILPANITDWIVKLTADTGHYHLGPLYDAKISAETLTQVDSVGAARPFAIKFHAEAKMLWTDKTAILLSLDHLVTNQLTHSIATSGGKTFTGEFGFSADFFCDKDMDGVRYIQIKADRIVLIDHASLIDWTNVIGDSAPTGAPATSDTLYFLNNSAQANLVAVPAGIQTLELKKSGQDAYDVMGYIQNGKVTIETVSQTDSLGRNVGASHFKLHIEADMMQGDEELALLDDVAGNTNGYRVTLVDGTVITALTSMGTHWAVDFSGDLTKSSTIKLIGEGYFTPAALVALIS